MTPRLTAADVRRLVEQGRIDTPLKQRTTRKTARGPYHTICVLCRQEFTTRASEDRHVADTGHPRYALVLP
jgi:hypothetical protein